MYCKKQSIVIVIFIWSGSSLYKYTAKITDQGAIFLFCLQTFGWKSQNRPKQLRIRHARVHISDHAGISRFWST